MNLRQRSVLQLYQNLVKDKALRPDNAQQVIAVQLDKLQRRLENYDLPTNVKAPTKVPRGLYIHGQVGTGKSMLMDMFYSNLDNKKRRVHFHAFLLDVHRRIHKRKQEHLETYGRSMHIELQPERDIIGTIAKEIATESPVLCFDEFQVIDIADAMIMRKFFSVLFQQGTVMVATSNTHPQVWKNLNYPPLHSHNPMDDAYFYPITPQVQTQVLAIVDELLQGGPPLVLETIPVMMGRSLQVMGQGDVCVVEFAALCNTDKGAADYKALSERFRVVVLTNIPQLTLAMHNRARRFITLLDELYEHKVRLISTAAVAPDALFQFDAHVKVPVPLSLASKQAALHDLQANHIKPFTSWDGPVAHDPATASDGEEVKNMSSMTDLMYACKRAVSRLHEMQTLKYQTLAASSNVQNTKVHK
ncbi:hypothetical protein DYB38_001560 [Aphanomyces astaci]|uniref:AAA+ ATPase domain-containing protein n=1 Tax=Aphanomyces astaci TaxID=112090 RepID=A0A397D232_APHAT|nr:hypothetical protein DYB38_001560 [Aphanomyces astaci]